MPLCQPYRRKRMEKVNHFPGPSRFLFLFLFLIFSCSQPSLRQEHTSGVYHLVKKQETLYSIARAYNIPMQKLAEVNDIKDVHFLPEGTVLYIPDARAVIETIPQGGASAERKTEMNETKNQRNDPVLSQEDTAKSQVSEKSSEETGEMQQPSSMLPIEKEPHQVKNSPNNKEGLKKDNVSSLSSAREDVKIDRKIFSWPVRGVIKTKFGKQPNKTFYNWVKIVTRDGTKVKAAASGTVIFSSNLKNYGETIILRHKNNYATVYTHLKKRAVKIDQNVKKGEVIALAGKKDEDGDVFINFEIRRKGKAIDPLLFLP